MFADKIALEESLVHKYFQWHSTSRTNMAFLFERIFPNFFTYFPSIVPRSCLEFSDFSVSDNVQDVVTREESVHYTLPYLWCEN